MLSQIHQEKLNIDTSPQQRCQKLDKATSAPWHCSKSRLILQRLGQAIVLYTVRIC